MASNLDEVMEKIQVRTDLERWSFRAEKAVQGTKTMVATVWPTLNLSFAHGREWQCHCRLCIGSPCLSCYPLIKDPKLHHLLSSLLGFWLCGSACWYSMPEYTVSMLFLWFPRRGLIGMRSSSSEFTPPLVKFPPGCSFSCFVLLWETLSCLPYHHQFRWCPKIAFSSTLVVQPLIWVARMMGFGGSTKYPRYMHCHSPGLLSLASSLSRRVGIEGWGKNKGKSVSRIQGIVVPKSSLVIILFHLAYYHGSDHAESE